MNKKFPFYKQLDQMDCGPTCLRMIAKHYGKIYTIEYLREKSHVTQQGVSFGGISEAAEIIGLRTLGATINYEILAKKAPLPCIVHWRQRHFIVVYEIKNDRVYVADPAHGLITYSKKEFLDGWLPKKDKSEENETIVLLFEATPQFYENEDEATKDRVGFKFLVPYFKPYRKTLWQVFLGLITATLLQLAFPFLTQSVVDYGINYQLNLSRFCQFE